ncbi:MAG: potassium/proton antiporter [Anaerolineae bacterium]|nr:potassium/proton antiporter [Anaerolineae bacterium]MDW8072231.1 potassium/proton antiporter [Anaerolineae bacterium]
MTIRALPIELIILIGALLLLLSVLASRASHRLGIPALLVFLVIGMLAGSDGPGGIHFDDPWLAQFLGSVALAYILFAGGLDTNWAVVRPVWRQSALLSTIGVVLTALLMGAFVPLVLDFPLLHGLLLGAVVSSTDAAAVFSILRSRDVRLRGNLEPLLELESGSNDPMAVFLTLGFTRLLSDPNASLEALLPQFVIQFVVGGSVGFGAGKLMVWLINHLRLHAEGLYPVLSFANVLLVFGIASVLRGNAFLAVYLAGITLGNHNFLHRRSLTRFHDGLAWLMQIVMFLVLGLLVLPSRLLAIAVPGILVAMFLIVVARPVSVLLTLSPFPMPLAEKAIVAWVGLRGAVPIVLATFPLLAEVSHAQTLFDLVFFVVLTSVLIQGTTIPIVARWLRIDVTEPVRADVLIHEEFVDRCGGELREVILDKHSPAVGRRIVDLDLPPEALVVLIKRDGEFIIPRGSVALEAGDRVLIAAEAEALEKARRILQGVNFAAHRYPIPKNPKKCRDG